MGAAAAPALFAALGLAPLASDCAAVGGLPCHLLCIACLVTAVLLGVPACLPVLAALERAHTAQATAMLSCLEESERVRLQQLSVACESPMGPLAGARGHRSEFTDDSSGGGGGGVFEDALEFSESASFASCPTPHGSSTSGGGGFIGGDGAASVFHSLDNSPEKPQPGSSASRGSSSSNQLQSPAGGGGSGGGARPKQTPPRKPASRS